ncbi:MAG: cytochrome c [Rhodothermales bacterium]
MKKIFKYTGIVAIGVVLLLILAGAGLYYKGGNALDAKYMVATAAIEASTDSSSLARGEHLVNMLGCSDCHGGNLAGRVMIDAPPFLVVASNLTKGKGGVGNVYSTLDYDRAMRNGVRPDGTPLIIMPSKAVHKLADADAAAIIGYIQSLPPVDNELPETMLRPLGRVLAASGQFDVGMEVSPEKPGHGTVPTLDDPLAYGKYSADMICAHCHQANFKGGVPMGPGPVPTDITAYGQIPVDQFLATLRTGKTPGGRELDQEAMPIAIFNHWSDDEIKAVHAYLATL